jgi:hypothetical protein
VLAHRSVHGKGEGGSIGDVEYRCETGTVMGRK